MNLCILGTSYKWTLAIFVFCVWVVRSVFKMLIGNSKGLLLLLLNTMFWTWGSDKTSRMRWEGYVEVNSSSAFSVGSPHQGCGQVETGRVPPDNGDHSLTRGVGKNANAWAPGDFLDWTLWASAQHFLKSLGEAQHAWEGILLFEAMFLVGLICCVFAVCSVWCPGGISRQLSHSHFRRRERLGWGWGS